MRKIVSVLSVLLLASLIFGTAAYAAVELLIVPQDVYISVVPNFDKRDVSVVVSTDGVLSLPSTVNWVANNAAIATVAGGTITAAAPGITTITAGVTGVGSVDCNVNVALARTSVNRVFIDKSRIDLTLDGSNETALITGTITAANATPYYPELKWNSSNPGVATVVNGFVKAVAPGTTTITFEEYPGYYTASCVVNVYSETVSIIETTTSPPTLNVDEGTTYQARVEVQVQPVGANQNVIWSSSNPTIANVSQSTLIFGESQTFREGYIYGVGPGTATITASTADGKDSVSWVVNVTRLDDPLPVPVTSILLLNPVMLMNIGDIAHLSADITPPGFAASNRIVSWTVDDPDVVRLDISGLSSVNVVALKQGVTKITAATNGGDAGAPFAECWVYVGAYVPVTGVSLPASLDIVVSNTGSLTATITPANASNKAVTWSTSNPAVATVDANGVVTGIASGDAVITATAVDKTNVVTPATCHVTVYDNPTVPEIITTTLPDGIVGVSYSYPLVATGTQQLSWSITGNFPDGLSMDVGGVISGTPTSADTYNFTVSVSNAAGTDTQPLSITIHPLAPPTITTTSLPNGTQGLPYSATLNATGTPPITWDILSGDLPTGLSLTIGGIIYGTPSALGTFTFTVIAENTEGDDTRVFSIVISAPVAPTITSLSSATVTSGTAGTFQVTATGTLPITYSLSGAPTGVSIDGATGLITIAATVPANTYNFTITATNGINPDDTQSFTLTVNPAPVAPVITTTTLPDGTVGTTYSATLAATGTAPITWDITSGNLPPGLTLDANTGEISGTPTSADAYDFTVRATNAAGNDTKALYMIIVPAPVAPTITSLNSATVTSGIVATFQVTATGDSPITFSLSGAPTGVSINGANGLITIAATVAANTYNFTITATNGVTPDATQSFTLTVTAAPVAPTITSLNSATVTSGIVATFQVVATGDPTITFSLSGAPTGVSINGANGLITIAATVTANTYNFSITATNGAGSDTQSFTLTVNPAPVAPTITSVNSTTVTNGTGGTFQVTATGDPTITFSLNGAPTGVSINGANGLMSIAGTVAANTYNFTITATNGAGSDVQNFTLTVTVAPVAPTITSANNTTVTSGTAGTFTVTATGDPTITFSLSGAPTGVSINGSTGVMSIAGTVAAGPYSFSITATNGAGSDVQNFTLTVNPAPVAPTITSANSTTVTSGTAGTFTVTATGDPTITFSLSGAPTGVSINGSTGLMTIAATVAAGPYSFTITATNGAGSDVQNFTLTVNPAPVAPTITSANSTTVTSGSGGTFTVTATGDPTITFSLSGAPTGVSINGSTGLMTIAATVAAGPYSFTITATNGVNPDATQTFTLTVDPAAVAPTITSANSTTVTSGAVGTFQVTATGDSPITFSLSGAPTGVSINGASGLITIAASVAENTYNFTITATNGVNPDDTQSFTLTVSPATDTPPTITSANSTTVISGTGGTFQVTATGTTPITYSLSGAPSGVSINGSTGLMTIAATVPASPYTFTITATNGIIPDGTQSFTLTVDPDTTVTPPTITTTALPDGTVGSAYSATLAASGTTPISWDISAGNLPDGLTLSSTGVISGTPSAAGTFNFTVRAANAAGNNTRDLSIVIVAVAGTPPTITTTTLPNGTIGTAYNATLAATGDAPITWDIASGSLPGGLTLSSAGVISGTPTTAGTFNFTVRATNADGEDTVSLSIVVEDAIVTVNPTFPSDKDDVAGKTGLDPDNFEERDGKVWLKKGVAESIAKNLLHEDEVDVYILPVFEGTVVPPGGIAEVSFIVKGKDLLALYPEDINLIGLVRSGGGQLFDYINSTADISDGKFTLRLGSAIYNGDIDPDTDYTIVAYIKDGGIFDLDGVVNGEVIASIFLAAPKSGSGSCGCNAAGLGYLPIVLVPFAFWKKRK